PNPCRPGFGAGGRFPDLPGRPLPGTASRRPTTSKAVALCGDASSFPLISPDKAHDGNRKRNPAGYLLPMEEGAAETRLWPPCDDQCAIARRNVGGADRRLDIYKRTQAGGLAGQNIGLDARYRRRCPKPPYGPGRPTMFRAGRSSVGVEVVDM